MVIEVEERGQVTVVSVEGSVDGTTAGELTSSLRGQVSSGNHQLVANLAGVDYTSSAGLRALLETVKDARQHGGDLRLAAVRPDVLIAVRRTG
jgi:anti-anti-sigma factor